MALNPTVKSILARICKALDDFSSEGGWRPGEYRILFRVSHRWGIIKIFFIIKDLGELSSQEMWVRVWDYLEKALAGEDVVYTLRLSVRDWKQVEQGGIYSIPPGFVDAEELLTTASPPPQTSSS
jgi:hypothetical protein